MTFQQTKMDFIQAAERAQSAHQMNLPVLLRFFLKIMIHSFHRRISLVKSYRTFWIKEGPQQFKRSLSHIPGYIHVNGSHKDFRVPVPGFFDQSIQTFDERLARNSIHDVIANIGKEHGNPPPLLCKTFGRLHDPAFADGRVGKIKQSSSNTIAPAWSQRVDKPAR